MAFKKKPPIRSKDKQKEVWLSPRTDNAIGLGTSTNPYNAGTRDKFDYIMSYLETGSIIHLYPGTYLTQGCSLDHTRKGQWYFKDGFRVLGAGKEVTTIRIEMTGTSIHDSNSYGVFVAPSGNPVTLLKDIEIRDLTIDCNFTGVDQSRTVNTFAWSLPLSGATIKNVIVKNWGCKRIGAGSAATNSWGRNINYENIWCIQPEFCNSQAMTAFSFTSSPLNREITVSNCIADGASKSGTLDWVGQIIQGAYLQGIDCTIRNSTFKNLKIGYLYSPSTSVPTGNSITIIDCNFDNVYWAIWGLFIPSISRFDKFKINNCYFGLARRPEQGTFYSNAPYGVVIQHAVSTSPRPISGIEVRNNLFTWHKNYTGQSGTLWAIYVGAATILDIRNNLMNFQSGSYPFIWVKDYDYIYHTNNKLTVGSGIQPYNINTTSYLAFE